MEESPGHSVVHGYFSLSLFFYHGSFGDDFDSFTVQTLSSMCFPYNYFTITSYYLCF